MRPRPPSPEDEAWAGGWLSAEERRLWAAQPAADRAHSLAVARRVAPHEERSAAVPEAERWVVAAALLHDVGKAEASLGVLGRSVATLVELAGVRRAPGRLGRYLHYPERGAARLAAAGSDARVVAWAREHHRAPEQWSGAVPEAVARQLAAADTSS
jgi:hypothetical protein